MIIVVDAEPNNIRYDNKAINVINSPNDSHEHSRHRLSTKKADDCALQGSIKEKYVKPR